MRASIVGIVVVAAVALCACQAVPANPHSTVLAYAEALRKNQPQAAYLLLSKAERRLVSADEFSRRWRDAAKEHPLLVQALETASPAREQAVVESSHSTSTLEREGSVWRLVDADANPKAGAHSVAEAVLGLASALEHRRLEEVFRLLSPPLQQAIERELDERVKALRALATKPVTGDATQLRLRYGPHYILQLRKGPGDVWQIDDLN